MYNAEIRGLYEYYKLANNVSVLNKYKYIMEYSMYKTFANKYNTSVKKYSTNIKSTESLVSNTKQKWRKNQISL